MKKASLKIRKIHRKAPVPEAYSISFSLYVNVCVFRTQCLCLFALSHENYLVIKSKTEYQVCTLKFCTSCQTSQKIQKMFEQNFT